MNLVGEKLDHKKAKCRELYIPDLNILFRNYKVTSWGVDSRIVDNTKRAYMFRMLVNGHHHQGYVYIFLNFLDLFDVYLTTEEDIITKRSHEMGVYRDLLIDWIDQRVERIPEYVR